MRRHAGGSGAGCVRGCEGGLILARGKHGAAQPRSARPKRQWAGVVQDGVGLPGFVVAAGLWRGLGFAGRQAGFYEARRL